MLLEINGGFFCVFFNLNLVYFGIFELEFMLLWIGVFFLKCCNSVVCGKLFLFLEGVIV